MRGLALSGAVFAAGLAGMLVGVALGQQERTPPTESKGFRTEVLATLDLADEIEGMAGRQLRMRRITVPSMTALSSWRRPSGTGWRISSLRRHRLIARGQHQF
jgi:hypothetical protein